MSIHVEAFQAAQVLGAICHAGKARVAEFDVAIVDELNRLDLVTIVRSRSDEAAVRPTLLGLMFNTMRLRLDDIEGRLKRHDL